MSTASYLDRFLEPMTEAFTPALARKLVDLRAAPELQAHIDRLRQKATEGSSVPRQASRLGWTLQPASWCGNVLTISVRTAVFHKKPRR